MAYRDDDPDGSSSNLDDKAERAADSAFRVHHDDPATTGDRVGEATGGVAGAATGAALGSLGGPIGTIIGGIAGAVGGWWTGRAVSEAASAYDDTDDQYYRSRYGSQGSSPSGSSSSTSRSYDDARPAYQVGHIAGLNPDYESRSFDDVERDLERGWSGSEGRNHGEWSDVRNYARDGYERGRDRRTTLSEEQRSVGKRQVPAGEVELHKTVETDRLADTADDLEPRVDGNPHSHPGPDASDRRI